MNVRGLRDKVKRRAIFNYCRERSDIALLQESHSSVSVEKLWSCEWGGRIIYSHGSSASKGVCLLINPKCGHVIKTLKSGKTGRLLACEVTEEQNTLVLINVYAPNDDQPAIFYDIQKLVESLSAPVIIMGNFNLVLNLEQDRYQSISNNNAACKALCNIMQTHQLEELWRVRNPNDIYYSWRREGPPFSCSRIDFALVSKGLDAMISNISYVPNVLSDHSALYMSVEVIKNTRGVGYWKLNASLLEKETFREKTRDFIKYVVQKFDYLMPIDRWERIKNRLRSYCQDLSRRCGSERKLIIAQLLEKVGELQQKGVLDEKDTKILLDSKRELHDLTFEQTKSTIFRCKARWAREGEKSTKYFFNLEKARYRAKTCNSMFNKDGELCSEDSQILEIQREFYQNLYTDNDYELKEAPINYEGTRISRENFDKCMTELRIEDLKEAVFTMKNGKTPGEDGFPCEMYKIFWEELKNPLFEAIQESFKGKKLFQSGLQGVLNLIPKMNKDTRYVQNLRPITLLNVDYKIIEKCLAKRINESLGEIINKNQTGFMKNRRISCNIRKLLDICEFTDKKQIPAIFINLDFKKAFDKVKFESLYHALQYFGFPKYIIDWTRILYTDFKVRVQNNGHFSTEINIQRGVHQGGNCSASYFILIAELLAIQLRANKEIKAIQIGNSNCL